MRAAFLDFGMRKRLCADWIVTGCYSEKSPSLHRDNAFNPFSVVIIICLYVVYRVLLSYPASCLHVSLIILTFSVCIFFMTVKYSSDVFSVVLVIYSYVVTGSVAIPVVDQQVNDDSNGLCSGRRHRRKHWLADDGCNECKCTKPEIVDVENKQTIIPVVSCTNLWCGPTFNDCLSGVLPCTGSNQVTYV